MTVLAGNNSKILIQGITGREASMVVKHMLDYGTPVAAGVTPGKGNTTVWGVPVFDTVSQAVAATGAEHLVIRTSGLLGRGGSEQKGGSFASRVLTRAREGQPLRVVADQRFSPTFAPDLAGAALALVGAGARGVFHLTNAGSCSWHELAVAVLELNGLDVPIEKIAAADLGLPARRPAFSVLDTGRYRGLGLAALRHWREALAQCTGPGCTTRV